MSGLLSALLARWKFTAGAGRVADVGLPKSENGRLLSLAPGGAVQSMTWREDADTRAYRFRILDGMPGDFVKVTNAATHVDEAEFIFDNFSGAAVPSMHNIQYYEDGWSGWVDMSESPNDGSLQTLMFRGNSPRTILLELEVR